MKLTHRLLGIAVVVAVFVAASAVFIHYTKPVSCNMPLSENQPIVKFEMDETLPQSVESETIPSVHIPPTPEVVTSVHEPSSASHDDWHVQMGAFAQQANADQLLKKLQHHGFHALTRSTVIQGKTITQVIVKPTAHDVDARVFVKRLTEVTQLNGRIITTRH